MKSRPPASSRFLVSLFALLIAGASTAPAQRLPLRTYSSDDGLGRSIIIAMTQDSLGFLWIGTPQGISRFDGLAFTSFDSDDGLPHDVIRSIFEDSRGRLWVGTEAGIARFENGRWSRPVPALDGQSVRCLTETPDGAIWAGTSGAGAARILDQAVTIYTTSDGLSHDRVRSVLVDNDGRLWLGTYGGGISRWDGEGFVNYRREQGLTNLVVRSLGLTKNGDLLAGTNHGPYVMAGNRFQAVAPASPLQNLAITAILVDSRDRLWFGTRDAGACRFESGAMNCISVAEGLPDASVNTVFEDHEGNLWFGTFGGGLSRLVTESIKIYTTSDGLPHGGVQAVGETPTSMWFATHGGGVSNLENDVFTTYSIDQGMPHDKVFSISTAPNDVVWVGTLSGAARIVDGRVQSFRTGVRTPEPVIYSILSDSQGNTWLGSLNGLIRVDRNGTVRVWGERDGLPSERLNHLIEAKDGGLWIATGDGLVRFDGERFDTLTTADGMPDNYIMHMLEQDDGTLWAATTQGLVRLRDGEIRTFSTGDGLSNVRCTAVLADDNGNIWVGTTRGVNVLRGDQFSAFSVRQGLPSSEVLAGSAYKSSDGRLWFGTTRGAVVFTSDAVSRETSPPPILISAITVDEEPVEVDEAIILAHDRSSLHLEFVAPCFWAPDDVQYQFQLIGVDPRPRISQARFSDYPALPPGNYDFSVRATCGSTDWSPAAAMISIEVTPPLWQLWWFRLIGVGLVLGLVVSGHKARLRSIRRREKWLEQEVEERTSELECERLEVRRKNEQLRVIDEIVAEINRQLDFTSLLEAILGGTAAVADSDTALALVRHSSRSEFRVTAHRNWAGLPAEAGLLSEPVLASDLLENATPLADGILLGHPRESGINPALGRLPEAFLVLVIDLDGQTEGYILVGGNSSALTDNTCVQTILGLRGHIRSALIKGRLVRELRDLNRTKNEFLGIAAHDLRSPLSSVISFAGLLLKQLHEDRFEAKRGKRFLSNIHTAANQMLSLVEELLDVAAIESGRVTLNLDHYRLADILEERGSLLEPAAQQKGIELAVDTSAAERTVVVDRLRIGEVLDNLLGNGIKFTHSGGQVRLWCDVRGNDVAVHVADTGVGLDEKDVARVFSGKRLSSRPTGGESSTGLGLVIVRKLVEEHGGSIRVTSQRGVGTTFTFTLPMAPEVNQKSTP